MQMPYGINRLTHVFGMDKSKAVEAIRLEAARRRPENTHERIEGQHRRARRFEPNADQ